MKSLFLLLSLTFLLSESAFARNYADATTAAEYLQHLKETTALALNGTDLFFDGGSLSFTFVAEDGKQIIFVLSAESQRKERKKLLSIYQDDRISLIPDSSYDESATLLCKKITAGLATGLQDKWPSFREDAIALCLLLKDGGHTKDLDEFYARATKRAKKEKASSRPWEPTSHGS